MGQRGPAPTPTATLATHGSWRAAARKKTEPQYRVCVPKPPEWVDKEARTFYRRLARKMVMVGVMTTADQVALGLFANCFKMYKDALTIVQDEGVILTGTNKLGQEYSIQHPACQIMNNCWDRCLKMCMQFGLTPSSRTGIQVGNGNKTSENEDARFFKAGS